MILEGIVTTQNDDTSPNISPMGPIVDRAVTSLVLRPYRTSRTYSNLKRTGAGVFHVTDDVELLARSAVNQLESRPPVRPAAAVEGFVLEDCCRWYEFRVARLNDHDERTRIECAVVDCGRERDFLGFNRAKHAVVEAAILATRIHLLPRQQILDDFERLAVIVEKTAGDQERSAFDLLDRYVHDARPHP